MGFDNVREVRLAQKKIMDIDRMLYELEILRTPKIGNKTNTLMMMASSIIITTRWISHSFSLLSLCIFFILCSHVFASSVTCIVHY